MLGTTTLLGESLMRCSSGSSQPWLASMCESKKTTTLPEAASAPRVRAVMRPARAGSRRSSTRAERIALTCRRSRVPSHGCVVRSLWSSMSTISRSRCGGVRFRTEWMERSSAQSASLWKMNTTLAACCCPPPPPPLGGRDGSASDTR
jgi:hypothetical protein